MKIQFLTATLLLLTLTANAQFGNLMNRVENAATNRANSKIDQGINKGLDKTEESIKNGSKKPAGSTTQTGQTSANTTPTDNSTSSTTSAKTIPVAGPPSMRSYANYDFVPGNKLIFEDDFHTDQDGEFGEHWDLRAGQAILNKVGDGLAMKITDGNYAVVLPLMKTKTYIPREFTLEFDHYQTAGAYGIITWFTNAEDSEITAVHVDKGSVSIKYQGSEGGRELSAAMPAEIANDNYIDRWHHVAMIVKGRTIKLYVDQYRVLNVPNNTGIAASMSFGGIGNQEEPIIFKNVHLAEGGGANVIGQKFGEGKYISYGINFDYGKATIKPESMGELSAIQKYLTENSGVRYEIGGFTDADGSDASNMTLSQKRADAVKAQLTSMGIDASRLTAKGYGETKPVGDNATFEGKALNRRVEFVKL